MSVSTTVIEVSLTVEEAGSLLADARAAEPRLALANHALSVSRSAQAELRAALIEAGFSEYAA